MPGHPGTHRDSCAPGSACSCCNATTHCCWAAASRLPSDFARMLLVAWGSCWRLRMIWLVDSWGDAASSPLAASWTRLAAPLPWMLRSPRTSLRVPLWRHITTPRLHAPAKPSARGTSQRLRGLLHKLDPFIGCRGASAVLARLGRPTDRPGTESLRGGVGLCGAAGIIITKAYAVREALCGLPALEAAARAASAHSPGVRRNAAAARGRIATRPPADRRPGRQH